MVEHPGETGHFLPHPLPPLSPFAPARGPAPWEPGTPALTAFLSFVTQLSTQLWSSFTSEWCLLLTRLWCLPAPRLTTKPSSRHKAVSMSVTFWLLTTDYLDCSGFPTEQSGQPAEKLVHASSFTETRRYGPLHGPTFSF